MKFISSLLGLLTLTICSGSFGDPDWIGVAKSTDDNFLYEIKISTLKIEKTEDGVPIAIVVGRDTDKKTSKVEINKWYVSISDCKEKMGHLVSLGIGGEFQFQKDFVFGGGNIASSIAQNICVGASYYPTENNSSVKKSQ